MPAPLLLVTGFGAFEKVAENASAALAEALAARPPAGCRVRSAVLPVSFRRAPAAWDALLSGLAPEVPDAILALGVQRETTFRLELRARARLRGTTRVDVDGVVPREGSADGRGELRTELDLEVLRERLRDAGAGEAAVVSRFAGGYVCERTYFHALSRGRELGRPALFLHVPPLRAVPLERQLPIVAELARALAGR